MILFFGELSPAVGRVVGRSFRVVLLLLLSSVGWCRLAFSFFGWCCFFPLLLGGAAFLLILWVWMLFTSLLLGGAAWPPLWVVLLFPSPFGWCCLPSPPLGSGAFSSAPFRPVLFLPGTSTTQRRERESSTTERKGEEGPPLN